MPYNCSKIKIKHPETQDQQTTHLPIINRGHILVLRFGTIYWINKLAEEIQGESSEPYTIFEAPLPSISLYCIQKEKKKREKMGIRIHALSLKQKWWQMEKRGITYSAISSTRINFNKPGIRFKIWKTIHPPESWELFNSSPALSSSLVMMIDEAEFKIHPKLQSSSPLLTQIEEW